MRIVNCVLKIVLMMSVEELPTEIHSCLYIFVDLVAVRL